MNREEVLRCARAIDERPLEWEEFDRRVEALLADEAGLWERVELVAWFMRRYPTARERLSYARRKYRELVSSPLDASRGGRGRAP